MEDTQTLFDLIYEKSFSHTSDTITLSSGQKTNYYFDLRQTTSLPNGINIIGKLLYDKIKQISGVRSVGGLESGSIAISTIISAQSESENPQITSFYARKNPKKHGLQKQVEGIVIAPAVIVDDVVTTGGSALKAINLLRNDNIEIKSLLCIVYRGTQEQKTNFEQENNLSLIPIFFEQEFIDSYIK